MKPNIGLLALSILCSLILPSLKAADYYWVGNSGDWSDISHWVTSSGGNIQHDQVPTADDDVYFDQNSFSADGQEVNVDIDIIFCRNLSWRSNDNVRFTSEVLSTLHCFGSLQLQANMQYQFAGDVVFRGDSPNTIQLAGHSLNRDVYFRNSNGNWTLQDAFVTDSILILEAGNLNTNDQAISCLRFVSEGSNQRELNLGASVVSILARTRPNRIQFWNLDYSMSISTNNLDISPGSSTLRFTAPRASMYVEGSQTLNLNDVDFSAPQGRSGIIKPRWNQEVNVSLGHLRFNSNGDLNGSNSMRELTLSPGKSYRLASGFSQRIDALNAPATCEAAIVLIASNSGVSAIIDANTAQSFSFLTIRDISVQGGATFALDQAIDLGNNRGWNLSPRAMRELYWVGGAGNWDDAAHWSLTDGGVPGECPPAAIDDVFFYRPVILWQ